MAVNLLEMAKGYLTDAVISRTSGVLNENPDGVQKALVAALPVFLSGLISRSSSPDGPGMLTSLIEQFTGNSSTATPSSDTPEQLMTKGSGLINTVFGPGAGLVSTALAQFSGIKSESASGVLSLAGSVITGLLGRQLMSQQGGVTASGLVGLVAGQREFIGAAMPSGLAALMGNIPGLGGLFGSGSAAVKGAVGSLGSAVAGATSFGGKEGAGRAVHTPAYSDDDNNSKGFNFWPWLLAALVAGLLFYFLRGCGNSNDTASASISDTTSASVQDATATMDSTATAAGALVDSAGSSIAAAADSAGSALANAAASLGAFGARKLPDGIELNIPANGIENKLIAFIEDKSKVVDKTTWFNFDRLLYETGSATLKPESREQLQNIAAILKAYPAVNLKIGGYTDNTGNAAANKKLSQNRADAAMAELIRLGVGQARLEAEGYGIEHPVASNATPEGRAQNRRTAVRVTKK
ncbi:OmpA family protein [Fibrella forsythiae]|uniref:OmpA family protein n=1 Tax=Fibrella forsythiae TaxID=2817061 RepID=A0ABS3JIX9_9BACT|nr:OmpA family protein [Fibrella forsythiae]MBO0949366.1 OmpA family protein [Fibrella forsythiae]